MSGKQREQKLSPGLGEIGIQSSVQKSKVIQSGTQKPNMGYGQCQMMRTTGGDTSGIMSDDGHIRSNAFILTDYTFDQSGK